MKRTLLLYLLLGCIVITLINCRKNSTQKKPQEPGKVYLTLDDAKLKLRESNYKSDTLKVFGINGNIISTAIIDWKYYRQLFSDSGVVIEVPLKFSNTLSSETRYLLTKDNLTSPSTFSLTFFKKNGSGDVVARIVESVLLGVKSKEQLKTLPNISFCKKDDGVVGIEMQFDLNGNLQQSYKFINDKHKEAVDIVNTGTASTPGMHLPDCTTFTSTYYIITVTGTMETGFVALYQPQTQSISVCWTGVGEEENNNWGTDTPPFPIAGYTPPTTAEPTTDAAGRPGKHLCGPYNFVDNGTNGMTVEITNLYVIWIRDDNTAWSEIRWEISCLTIPKSISNQNHQLSDIFNKAWNDAAGSIAGMYSEGLLQPFQDPRPTMKRLILQNLPAGSAFQSSACAGNIPFSVAKLCDGAPPTSM
ncbi:hypothetical protein [Deminuibacter soli]|uniref:Uncharacterized protein n=1 Tax=Deminuibacter soli TaxID=2291815 RepID=A0A3E1NLS8_9BACT|nr:hypothetical protein [Deminuibacter soli]RFM28886.1 hypothetical protein DXN05_08950 [Deminuibacter soli]